MRATTCVLLLLFIRNASGQETQKGELAGRPVGMMAVKADELFPVPWPQGRIELKQTSATVTRGANVYMLLQLNGIAPDPGAFALVYDLNPTIRDVDALAPNTSLQLPIIASEEVLQKLLQGRDLVEITVDPEIRRQLNQQIEVLQSFLPVINGLATDPNAQAQLRNLIEWYQQIERRFKRKTDPPLRQATLLELLNEADLLSSILEDSLRQHKNLADNDQRQISAIDEDIRLEMTEYGQILAGAAPKAQNFYSVTVNIKGLGSAHGESLRVYYTYNGLFRPLPAEPPVTSWGFTQLGSGKSENLLMKNYQIWAAKDGDSNNPVTHPYPLKIDQSTPTTLTIDLSLISRAQP